MLAAGLSGILASRPEKEAELRPLFSSQVNEAIDLMRLPDFCVLNVVARNFGLDWMPLLQFSDDTTIFDFEPIQQLVRQETLLANNRYEHSRAGARAPSVHDATDLTCLF